MCLEEIDVRLQRILFCKTMLELLGLQVDETTRALNFLSSECKNPTLDEKYKELVLVKTKECIEYAHQLSYMAECIDNLYDFNMN